MKDLWLTYDTPIGDNFMTILEDCEIDESENGDTIIRGGIEVPITLNELKTITKIFTGAIDEIEKESK